MAQTITTRWDPVDHLETEEDIEAYLMAALEVGDPTLVLAALCDIARRVGKMEQVSHFIQGEAPISKQ